MALKSADGRVRVFTGLYRLLLLVLVLVLVLVFGNWLVTIDLRATLVRIRSEFMIDSQ